jgi:hypothetical protein
MSRLKPSVRRMAGTTWKFATRVLVSRAWLGFTTRDYIEMLMAVGRRSTIEATGLAGIDDGNGAYAHRSAQRIT